jgi:hypothetical protein
VLICNISTMKRAPPLLVTIAYFPHLTKNTSKVWNNGSIATKIYLQNCDYKIPYRFKLILISYGPLGNVGMLKCCDLKYGSKYFLRPQCECYEDACIHLFTIGLNQDTFQFIL